MQHSRTYLGAGLALICTCLMASFPVISNGRPAGFDALGFAFFLSFYQFLFSLPLFLTEQIRHKRPARSAAESRKTLNTTLFTGFIYCAAIFLFVFGSAATGTVTAAIALNTSPLFAILIEVIFLRRTKTATELAFTAVLMVTLYYLGTNGTWNMSGLNVWFLVVLLVPLLWSTAHIIIREELASSPLTPAQITCFRVGLSALLLGVVMVVSEPAALLHALMNPQWQLVAALMGLLYYTELVIWFHAIRYVDVSFASSVIATSPALTMVFAYLFLHETVQPYQVLAFIILVIAILGLTALGALKHRAAAAAISSPAR